MKKDTTEPTTKTSTEAKVRFHPAYSEKVFADQLEYRLAKAGIGLDIVNDKHCATTIWNQESQENKDADKGAVRETRETKETIEIAQDLCKEDEEAIPAYDSVDELTELTGLSKEIKAVIYKGGNIDYVDGIAKFKGPIVRVCSKEKHEEASPYKNPEIDCKMGEEIAESYGAGNYGNAISLTGDSSFFPKTKHLAAQALRASQASQASQDSSTTSMSGLIPDTDNKKMFCNEDELLYGKEFCKENNAQMKDQMNVVALYSIKDAKPFYYISSAEARLAIDYIAKCRTFKQDTNAKHIEIIETLVMKVDSLIAGAENSQREDYPEVCVFNRDLATFSSGEGMSLTEEIQHSVHMQGVNYNIFNIYKTAYPPYRRDSVFSEANGLTLYNKYRVEVPCRSIKAAHQVIELHPKLNALETHMHYIVCGTEAVRLVLNDDSNKVITAPNLTERQQFNIVGHRNSNKGSSPIFLNKNIDPNSIVIVSKDFSNEDDVVIMEYYLDKAISPNFS